MPIAVFTGLTAATLLGVPFGAWLGLAFGWRTAFCAVATIGSLAAAMLAALVSVTCEAVQPALLERELAMLARPQVQLGLLMTVLGFAGAFVVFTYIQPILTRISGFPEAAVSPILLVFRAVVSTLAILALVLAAMTWAVQAQPSAAVFTGLLGAAAFATVTPLQAHVLDKAGSAGQDLASSLNIAAFNLGNALGAWLGGVTIDHGAGLDALLLVAAMVTATGLGVALLSVRLDRQVPAFSAG